MTIAFKELAGSPIESYGPDGVQAERRLLCAWDERRLLVQQLLGDGYEFGGSSRATYPGTDNVVAMRARVEAFGDDVVKQSLTQLTEGLNAYHGFAKVTISYELLVPSDRADLPRRRRARSSPIGCDAIGKRSHCPATTCNGKPSRRLPCPPRPPARFGFPSPSIG